MATFSSWFRYIVLVAHFGLYIGIGVMGGLGLSVLMPKAYFAVPYGISTFIMLVYVIMSFVVSLMDKDSKLDCGAVEISYIWLQILIWAWLAYICAAWRVYIAVAQPVLLLAWFIFVMVKCAKAREAQADTSTFRQTLVIPFHKVCSGRFDALNYTGGGAGGGGGGRKKEGDA